MDTRFLRTAPALRALIDAINFVRTSSKSVRALTSHSVRCVLGGRNPATLCFIVRYCLEPDRRSPDRQVDLRAAPLKRRPPPRFHSRSQCQGELNARPNRNCPRPSRLARQVTLAGKQERSRPARGGSSLPSPAADQRRAWLRPSTRYSLNPIPEFQAALVRHHYARQNL